MASSPSASLIYHLLILAKDKLLHFVVIFDVEIGYAVRRRPNGLIFITISWSSESSMK